MAKCKFCGAEVTIGERCTYCGSKAEGWYYSGEEKKQEPKKKKASHDRVRDLFNGKIYIVKKEIAFGILLKICMDLEQSITGL
jgi:hypothetical protein